MVNLETEVAHFVVLALSHCLTAFLFFCFLQNVHFTTRELFEIAWFDIHDGGHY